METFNKNWWDSETWTVRELIEALSKLNPELKVLTEGCDCYGSVDHLELDEDTVTLMRHVDSEVL